MSHMTINGIGSATIAAVVLGAALLASPAIAKSEYSYSETKRMSRTISRTHFENTKPDRSYRAEFKSISISKSSGLLSQTFGNVRSWFRASEQSAVRNVSYRSVVERSASYRSVRMSGQTSRIYSAAFTTALNNTERQTVMDVKRSTFTSGLTIYSSNRVFSSYRSVEIIKTYTTFSSEWVAGPSDPFVSPSIARFAAPNNGDFVANSGISHASSQPKSAAVATRGSGNGQSDSHPCENSAPVTTGSFQSRDVKSSSGAACFLAAN